MEATCGPSARATGVVPSDGWLYLWLAETDQWAPHLGLYAAEMGLSGSLDPLAFEPSSGVVVPGVELPDLLFAVPECESAPFLAGRILVDSPSPREGSSWGRTKALYR